MLHIHGPKCPLLHILKYWLGDTCFNLKQVVEWVLACMSTKISYSCLY